MKKKSNYTLEEISKWAENNEVSLPNVQRSFVWKPSQIENLWDSLLRGYPIGAFVLSPSESKNNFEMLDGQQRATSICLGFGKDTFRDSQDKIKIFIDLEKPKSDDNRKYIFRVITKSHPWGYMRSDNTKTLTSENIRNAMNVYDIKDHLEEKLDNFFPFDASLPVPFDLFISAVLKNEMVEKLIQQVYKNPHWKTVKENWDAKIDKIRLEKNENPDIKKELPELSSKLKIESKIKEIFESVKVMLGDEEGQKIPVLYLNFDKFKKSIDYSVIEESKLNENNESVEESEDNNNSNDEIENLFIRLNSGGTPLRGEDLNYSILKSKISSELQEEIENACKGLFKPSRFITIAYRLFQQQKNVEQRDALTMRIKPKQFQRTISESNEHFEKFIIDLLHTKNYNGKTLIDYAKYLLEFNSKNNKYGLPYLITSKIADTAPEVMFMLLYRLMIHRDSFEFGTDIHRKMIGMVTMFMWLGKGENQRDHSKLLSNIWPCAKELIKELFWSSSTVQRALLREILVPLPLIKELSKIKKINVQSNTKLIEKYNKKYSYGMFLEKMFYNRDLVLYSQRLFLSEFFKEEQFDLDDTNVPFDWDHISPNSFILKKKHIPHIIKQWYNSNGNFRAWPYSLNRIDQDDVPAIKFDPLEPKNYAQSNKVKYEEAKNKWIRFIAEKNIKSAFKLRNQLLLWSFCDNDKNWAKCKARDMRNEWKEVHQLILNRNLAICRVWYSQLKIDNLIPSNREIFNSIIGKDNWNLSKINGTNRIESDPISIGRSEIRIYFEYEKDPVLMLEENGIEFGIFEKDSVGLIYKTKIPDLSYEKDKKNIKSYFTLISHDESSYFKLFEQFRDWFKKFKEQKISNLSNTFVESLSLQFKDKIKDINVNE